MLNMYMGYSAGAGTKMGACLIFAHSAKEARKIGWQETNGMFADEYIDYAVRILRGSEWLYKEANKDKLANDIPHVIVDVRSCKNCGLWGISEINEDGLCIMCEDMREFLSQYPLY